MSDPGDAGARAGAAPGGFAADLLHRLADDPASARERLVFPTGFEPLDDVLGGGLRTHALTLLGGPPAVGKTVATLQWARTMAGNGSTVVFACYEHDEQELLGRLLCLELGTMVAPGTPSLHGLRAQLLEAIEGRASLTEVMEREALIRLAHDRVAAYADRLVLLRASGRSSDLAALEAQVEAHGNGQSVLVVDYLQKVPVVPPPAHKEERITRVAEGLKDLALQHDIAVLAVCAVSSQGLDAQRVQLRHLRGASTLSYESDVVIMMNDKLKAVSNVHRAYDALRAETFKDYVVFSVEKNRSAPGGSDLEFAKDFASFRFDPHGKFVSERLVDDVVVLD